MAGNIPNYLETRLLEHSVGKTAFTIPSVVALALFTTTPDVDTGASGVEVTVTSSAYVRINLLTHNGGGTVFGTASAGNPSSITTVADITFPTATASWGTILGLGLYDSVTVGAGNPLWIGPLAASKTIATGDVFKILAGQLTLSFD